MVQTKVMYILHKIPTKTYIIDHSQEQATQTASQPPAMDCAESSTSTETESDSEME